MALSTKPAVNIYHSQVLRVNRQENMWLYHIRFNTRILRVYTSVDTNVKNPYLVKGPHCGFRVTGRGYEGIKVSDATQFRACRARRVGIRTDYGRMDSDR